ncbi:MAG: RNA-directed DNA polymerase [Bacilli bacterium]
MKRYNNIYNKITDINVILNMYNIIYKNIRNKNKLYEFDKLLSINLINIKEKLITNTYIPGEYNIFLIHEPKVRIIMSQNIEDKIINHLVAKYLLIDIFDKTLINENCATRINKGTHYALNLFKNYYNKYKNKYEKFYILKFDISKYFYNIDHDIVKELISNKIKDKKALNILFKIIDSTDEEYVNKKVLELKQKEINRINKLNISDKEKLKKIEEIKSIPNIKKGKSMSIGNMVSQVIATFYLNELDHHIKEKLNKHYIRYQDDGVLFSNNKEYLKYCLKEIEIILNKYKLKLNNKTKIYSNKEEIIFLGFRFFIKNNKTIIKISNKTKKNFKKKLKTKNINIISSYIGHLKYGTCNNLIYKGVHNEKN